MRVFGASWQPRPPSSNRGWLLLLGSALVLMGLSAEVFVPALPAVSEAFHADIATTQLTITSFLFGVAAGQFVGGPIGDHVGRRPPFLAGFAIFTVGAALAATSSSIGVLIAARAVCGIGVGAAVVTGNAVIRDRYFGTDAA